MKARIRVLTILVVPVLLLGCRQRPVSVSLKDGDECKKGEDCTCVHVTCKVGCTCTITVGLGICTDCPIPETPPKSVVAGVVLPLDLFDSLVLVAEAEDVEGEELIRQALREFLDRQ